MNLGERPRRRLTPAVHRVTQAQRKKQIAVKQAVLTLPVLLTRMVHRKSLAVLLEIRYLTTITQEAGQITLHY